MRCHLMPRGVWLLPLLWLVWMPMAWASDNASVLLERFFANSQTVTADFVQEVVNHNGEIVQRATGKLWLARPGRFRWDYAGKNGQVIVSDGKKVWLYEPALQQVTVQPLGKALGATPAALIAGNNVLPKDFEISALPTKDGLLWVLLKPKTGQSQGFTAIQMGFTANGTLRVMEMEDDFQQRTILHFHNVQINTRIAPGTFRFIPPHGVDILSNP